MKFGVCCGLDQARFALDTGFDYVELAAVGFQGRSETWDPAPYQGLPIRCTNVFFPGDLPLYQSDWRPYAQRTIERAGSLGVRTMVIGSGAARRSAGIGVEEAEERFLDLVAACQEIASYEGIVVAPESLEQSETDVWNELGRMALALEEHDLAYTADSFHLLKEWDRAGRVLSIEEAVREEVPIVPAHVHLGDLPRNPPSADDPMIQTFASRLQELGYDSTVSLECNWRDFRAQLPEALANLQQLFPSS